MRRLVAFFILALVLLISGFVHFNDSHAIAAEGKKSGAAFEVYQDKAGEYRWRLRTTNSQVIATSGAGYKEKRSCMDGIESVKKNAKDAEVKEIKEEEGVEK